MYIFFHAMVPFLFLCVDEMENIYDCIYSFNIRD